MEKIVSIDKIDHESSAIQKLRDEISDIDEQIERMKELRKERENELDMKISNVQTYKLLQSVYEVNEGNSISVELFADTQTTPIMDNYYFSDKRFLLFKGMIVPPHRSKSVSLVVAKSSIHIKYRNNGMTMTDLKKNGHICLYEGMLKFYKSDSRMYPLYEEIINLGDTSDMLDGDVVPLNIPVMLHGQTFDDQTGYGSEYNGEYLVYKGKEYGEATRFFIIGIQI